MIKLKEIIRPTYLYHVTPEKNISTMKQSGIVPVQCEPSHISLPAIYLFNDKTIMEDALMNWLGDKFDENEKLIYFTIDPRGIDVQESDVKYEVVSYETIPWKNVIKIDKI